MVYGTTNGNNTGMKRISNDDYSTEWESQDNRRIMDAASAKYRGRLPDDEIQSCQMIALWRSILTFKSDVGTSFTTYLYNIVDNLCNHTLKKQYRHTQHLQNVSVYQIFTNDDNLSKIDIDEAINNLPNNLKKVIVQRFYDKMTLEEIAQTNGYSHETARRRVKNALCQMKTKLQSNYCV